MKLKWNRSSKKTIIPVSMWQSERTKRWASINSSFQLTVRLDWTARPIQCDYNEHKMTWTISNESRFDTFIALSSHLIDECEYWYRMRSLLLKISRHLFSCDDNNNWDGIVPAIISCHHHKKTRFAFLQAWFFHISPQRVRFFFLHS